MPTLALTAFENDLRLTESILRHLVVRQDEVPIRPIVPTTAGPVAQAGSAARPTPEAEPDEADLDTDDTFDPDLVPPADE
jgi:hypothetical protein